MLYCVSYLLLGARFLAGGREGGPALRFSGFFRVASLSGVIFGNLGLGSGCSGPFGSPVGFVWGSVSGSTIVPIGIPTVCTNRISITF